MKVCEAMVQMYEIILCWKWRGTLCIYKRLFADYSFAQIISVAVLDKNDRKLVPEALL